MNENIHNKHKSLVHEAVMLMYEMLPCLLPFRRNELKVAFSTCLTQMWDYYSGKWACDDHDNQQPRSAVPGRKNGSWDSFLEALSRLAGQYDTGYMEIINTFREKPDAESH